MNRDLHFTNATDEHPTPQDVFDRLNARYGPFALDAAATAHNAKCERFYTIADDALTQPWNGRVWCNPPYSQTAAFVEHAIGETRAGRAETVVMLVPANTSTVWWREAYEHADDIEMRSGKIRFGDAKHAAPFGSCAFVFRARRQHTWSATDATRYTMPKRHNTRPRWFTIKQAVTPRDGGPNGISPRPSTDHHGQATLPQPHQHTRDPSPPPPRPED